MMASTAAAAACGPKSRCAVEGGYYHIRMPANATAETPVGAIVYFHGYRGSAAGVMANKSLARAAGELSVALVAPHGDGKTWSFPGSPSQRRDEMAFVDEVLDDAIARFPVDPDRLMATGFSIGGTMNWYLACYRGFRFAGFAPIAGAFWRPHPESCPSPDPFLTHVHGMADKVVPMAGRAIRDRWHQGDVREGIAYWRGRHGPLRPRTEIQIEGRLSCERTPTAKGGAIELCLHDGGHSMRTEWVVRGWKRLTAFRGWRLPDRAAHPGD